MDIELKKMKDEDWPAVRDIYLAGIETGEATLETAPPDWSEWDATHLIPGRLVAQQEGRVIGWAALSPVSGRCVYAGVAEVSIYVAADVRGQGVGRALLMELCDQSEMQGLWTLQAGIFPENEASLALHRGCGFRQVGRRERIGKMDGHWRDVILMERRSPKF